MISDILVKKYITVELNDTISSLIGKSKRETHFFAVVLDKAGRYKGVADKHKLLALNVDTTKTKISKIVTKVPLLDETMDLLDAVKLFFASGVHALPVMKNNSVSGVVMVTDLLGALRSKLRGVKVQDLGTNKLVSLNENDPISKAMSTCKSKGISRLPIVNAQGSLMGICTVEDILYSYHQFPTRKGSATRSKSGRSNPTKEHSKNQLPIGDLMNPLLWTAKPDDSASKVVDAFQKHNIGSVVIASANKPIGIVTVKDVLRFLR